MFSQNITSVLAQIREKTFSNKNLPTQFSQTSQSIIFISKYFSLYLNFRLLS